MTISYVRKILTTNHRTVNSTFWAYFWSIGLALGWLLPNHYVPWVAFHVDAWISWFFLIAAITLSIVSKKRFPLHKTTIFTFIICLIPALQYYFGILSYSGIAWICFAYVLGFACAIMFGAAWELYQPNQAINSLFFAIGIAAVVSVGFQLYQWLRLDISIFDLWILAVPNNRPFANLIQPNQLATLLMWGLIAIAWSALKGQLQPCIVVSTAVFLLFGVALTQSKTAFVSIIIATPVAILMRRLGIPRTTIWIIASLTLFYITITFTLPYISSSLYLNTGPGISERESGSVRLAAYKMLLDAVTRSPWTGYGWSQTAAAQLEVAADHPFLGGIFMQSHNIFLDLLVWCGIPIGFLISLIIIYWLLNKLINIKTKESALLFAFIAIISWHAMLELPLHYAYFLLPTGLIVGSLCQKSFPTTSICIHKTYALAIFLCLGIILSCITRDYFHIEESFTILRFERAKIGIKPAAIDEHLIMLDQMEAFIEMGRAHPAKGMQKSDLEEMRRATTAYPSLGNFFTLALALTRNDQFSEAQSLVVKIPNITTPDQYSQMKNIWENAAKNDANLRLIHWPQEP